MLRIHCALFNSVALLLASNYFAFQIELFEEEYEANHPQPLRGNSLSAPTLTWESFDKENAPQPFTFDALVTFNRIGVLLPPPFTLFLPHHPYFVPRDKSPPAALSLPS